MPNLQSSGSPAHPDFGAFASALGTDRHLARRLYEFLAHVSQTGITVHSEAGDCIDLSPSLAGILEAAAGIMARGESVTVLARDTELTTQQVAEILNVSRQYVVRLLERGDIASTRVGTHRRVRASDLTAYYEARQSSRHAALDELASAAQAAGAYDKPVTFGPRRE